MVGIVRLLVAISSLTLLVRAAPSPPKYVELYTEQMVDHFNYELQDTFMERYFLSGELTCTSLDLYYTKTAVHSRRGGRLGRGYTSSGRG